LPQFLVSLCDAFLNVVDDHIPMLHGRPFHYTQSKHLHFNLYRCTEFVTYTASSLFTVGYAYSYQGSFIDYSSAPTDSSSAGTAKNEAGQARVLLGERRKHEGKKMVGFAFPWPNVLASLVSTYRFPSVHLATSYPVPSHSLSITYPTPI
jgi:hypothetical protein